MNEGVRLHNLREYEAARDKSLDAYALAPAMSFEKGRAARDTGARYDRLGQSEEAMRWANEAYDIHNQLVYSSSHRSREVYRERSVSAMYVGAMGLRKIIHARLEGVKTEADLDAPLTKMRQSWSDIQLAKKLAESFKDKRVDQYEINASRRVSMTESLIGNRKAGLQIGARAVRLALASESPRMSTSTPGLPRRARLQAKVKAFVAGVKALGVGVIASPKSNRRQRLAYKITDKTL